MTYHKYTSNHNSQIHNAYVQVQPGLTCDQISEDIEHARKSKEEPRIVPLHFQCPNCEVGLRIPINIDEFIDRFGDYDDNES